MKTVVAAYPELDALRINSKALPVCRPWDLSGVCLTEFAHPLLEYGSTGENAALIGDSCADLAFARTAVEVFIHCGGLKVMHLALDAYLPAKRLPVKAEGCVAVCPDLAALAALGIRKEAEAFRLDLLNQHHAHTGYGIS